MKIHFEKITPPAGTPLLVRRVAGDTFAAPLHFHPELELTLIESSAGKRFVGDSIEPFEAGDVVLLGENLPHFWSNTLPGLADTAPAQAVVVQFGADFLGSDFWKRAGGRHIEQLLHDSRRGLCLQGATRAAAAATLAGLPECPAFEQVLTVLALLHQLAEAGDYRPLSSPGFRLRLRAEDCSRLNQVYGYIYANLNGPPSIGTAADLLCMSPSAFCHYFKKRTQKTFSQVVNEARIGQARQWLMETDRPVSDIGYHCGFATLSNFNKQFAHLSGCSPSRFRQRYQVAG